MNRVFVVSAREPFKAEYNSTVSAAIAAPDQDQAIELAIASDELNWHIEGDYPPSPLTLQAKEYDLSHPGVIHEEWLEG